jgi:zinc protease
MNNLLRPTGGLRVVLAFVLSLSLLASARADNTQSTVVDQPVHVVARIAADDDTVVARLSNGMTLIARAVHTAPVVSVRGYVRAGGILEGQWLGCGLSHLLEHLVAEYTVTDGADGIHGANPESLSEKIGAQANAYTTSDHTCYYVSATAEKVNQCIEIITGQLARPDISRGDFQREHGVVQRELDMGRDDPSRIMYYTHQANLYRDHPAAVPTIGFAGPLSKVTYEDVMAYHAQKYVPQNMVIAIVGDIDPGKAIDEATRHLRDFKKGREPELAIPAVPPVTGVRRLTRESAAFTEASEFLSFQTIDLFDKDLHALDVLSFILSQGRASRLVADLQFRRKLVTSVSSYSHTPAWGKGSFTITFRTAPDQADTAEQAILDHLRAIAEQGVTAEELARAKRQKISTHVRGQQTAGDIAAQLATDLFFTGDLAFSANYTDRIQDVTAEQVQAVAKKYFDFDSMVITRIVPPAEKAETKIAAKKQAQGKAEMFTLPNGMKVILQPSSAVKLTAMVLATKGGLLLEDETTNGLGTMMTALSTRGAGEMTGQQISAFFDAAGGSVSAICGDNSFLYSASVLSDSFDKALPVFADVVLRPTFPQDQLDVLRPMLIAGIRRQEEHWQGRLNKFFRGKFFDGAPWQMLSTGAIPVVEKVIAEQLKAWHDKVVRSGDAVLAIYGDFDPARTRLAIEKLFAAMPEGKAELTIPQRREVDQAGELYTQQADLEQAGIMIGLPGTTRTNLHDTLALKLIDTVISGYHLPGGWLHKELRGKELVYVVHAINKTGFAPGAFLVYAGTRPDKAAEVVSIIRKNLNRAASHPYSREELDRAITTIVTAEVLNSQSLDDLATSAALNEMYGMGWDYSARLEGELRKLTPEEVQAVAKKYFTGKYVVTVVTPKPELLDGAEIEQAQQETP